MSQTSRRSGAVGSVGELGERRKDQPLMEGPGGLLVPRPGPSGRWGERPMAARGGRRDDRTMPNRTRREVLAVSAAAGAVGLTAWVVTMASAPRFSQGGQED